MHARKTLIDLLSGQLQSRHFTVSPTTPQPPSEGLMSNRLWVLKKGYPEAEVGGVWVPRRRVSCTGWKPGRHGERRSGHLTEKRTNRLMFLGSPLPGRTASERTSFCAYAAGAYADHDRKSVSTVTSDCCRARGPVSRGTSAMYSQ